jgi:DNA-binding SARP family transcriptional activator/predicted ATPase
MASLKIYLLDAFHVELDGRSVTDFTTDKVRALLAYLAVERRRSHRRDRLAALLWPDQDDHHARHNLRQALSSLRHALHDADDDPRPYLLVDRQEIQLNPAADLWLDVAAFTALAERCRNHRHRAVANCLPCLYRLAEMVHLYTGDFLAGFGLNDSALFEEWALLKREWLHCQTVEALVVLADFYEQRGEFGLARQMTQRQVIMESWREEAHRQLIRLLAREGLRSAALAQYERCRQALLAELGVPPTNETVELYVAIRDGRYPQEQVVQTAVSDIPLPATPFIGRADELNDLAEWLAQPETRLITLVGPGGIGKSRLAMAMAATHRGLYADGVYWLELAPLSTAAQIVPAVAHRLGLALTGKGAAETELLAYLRAKKLLLVLDNAEHLPELADAAARWLAQAPGLVLLVTSREKLALREERLFELVGLRFDAGAISKPDALLSDAARLFIQSAQRQRRTFDPDPVELQAIAEVCRLVEGMPLALELAAAWTEERGCAEIARTFAQGIALPPAGWRNIPERQRTMEATFDHSWRLLVAADQSAARQLALFRGGFTAAAAQAVAGVTQVTLARLTSKSFLRRVGDNRYQMHELLRQFLDHKLAALPDQLAVTTACHAAYYLDFLSAQEKELKGKGQQEALAAVDREMGNIRLAWQWATAQMAAGQGEAATAIQRGLESLFLFHALHCWYQAGATLFEQAATAVNPALPDAALLRGALLARRARCLEFTAPAEEATVLYRESLACFQAAAVEDEQALPLYGLGYMAYIQGEYAASADFLQQSLTRYRAVADLWGEANVLGALCQTRRRQGAFVAARQAGEESLAIRQAIGDRRGVASSHNHLAFIYCAAGEYAAAQTAWLESVAICRELGHTVGVANALTGLCQIAFHQKDYPGAIQYQQEALVLYRQAGDTWGEAIAYNNLGQLTLVQGDAARARQFLHDGIALYRQLGMKTGLAHTLSNLAQAYAQLGKIGAAAQALSEALQLAAAVGDRPIILEGLARAAVLWRQQQPDLRPLAVLSFVRQQPEMLQETRLEIEPHYLAWQTALTPVETAVVEETAAAWGLTAVIAEISTILNGFTDAITEVQLLPRS